MRGVWAIATLALVACASNPAVQVVDGDTPVEQQILRSHQTYASANAAVSGPAIAYSTTRTEDWSSYRSIIEGRIHRDLAEIYEGRTQRADRSYLLFGTVGDHDIVEVIRLGASDPTRPNRQSFDGLYAVGPLTYVFDPTNHAVLSVSGPVAGEY